jgi:hypothetical protein
MRFWIREIAGWGLVLLGLLVFYQCYLLLNRTGVDRDTNGVERVVLRPQYIAAGQWSIIGIFLFRGGIHLLKVAVAARVCLEARDHDKTDKKPAPTPRRTAMPVPPPAAIPLRPPLGKQAV